MFALVISIVATLFIYTRIKRQLARGDTTKLVVSASALEAGTPLTEDKLSLIEWPSSLSPQGSFHKATDVVGRILAYPIPAKEAIREELLAAPGSVIGLTAKIPEGMRAVAVVTNEVNNVSGFLFPGSHVDVVVTLKDQAAGPDQALTITVLQNVEVLSTGERLQPDPSGKPQNVRVVTLLLNSEDSQKLMLANNEGIVQFVMRNGGDQEKVETKPVDIHELRGTAAPKKVVKAAATPKPFFEVETYDGAKKGSVKF